MSIIIGQVTAPFNPTNLKFLNLVFVATLWPKLCVNVSNDVEKIANLRFVAKEPKSRAHNLALMSRNWRAANLDLSFL